MFSTWTYPQLPVLQIFIFSSGLTSDSQFFKFSFFHLPGLTSDCQFFIFFFTWTYLWVPVWLCFDFITHVCLIGLTPLMPCFLGFETLWKSLIWLNYLLSSESLSEAFIECKTLFHFASLFQMSKQISDAMYHAMYDRARMKCPSLFRIPFSSFFSLFWWMRDANVICKCHDWSYQCVI